MRPLLLIWFLLICLTANSATYYLSPTGNDTTGDGSISTPWFTLNKAWTVVSAGDIIYLRGGTYQFDSRQTLSGKNGTITDTIKVYAYQNEQPILTKSGSFTTPSWPVTLVYLQGNYTHWYNIEITGFTQATSTIWYGMAVRNSNNNVFERINSHHNGHGMVIRDNSTNNIVLNSDFHHNYDPISNTPYDDADGLEVGYLYDAAVNTIVGCRFYYNSDDGLDLWQNNGNVIIEGCWSFCNGYREDKTTAGGNGNGLKMGSTTTADGSQFKRTIKNNLSFYNRSFGIAQNEANCKMYYYNNTIYANGNTGISFYSADNANIVRNNISFANTNGNYSGNHANSTIDHNTYDASWQPTGIVASVADFASVDTTGVSGARVNDLLPTLNFMKLSASSALINAGIDVGIPYTGIAPDLGAFEYIPPVPPTGTKKMWKDSQGRPLGKNGVPYGSVPPN